jgi:hypothetical protein
MTISDVLSHPWIVGDDEEILDLRCKAATEGDKVLEFVAFSNVSMAAVE